MEAVFVLLDPNGADVGEASFAFAATLVVVACFAEIVAGLVLFAVLAVASLLGAFFAVSDCLPTRFFSVVAAFLADEWDAELSWVAGELL